jgi:succinate dehydrogenase/fumarate reductase flavoprotein subunit
MNLGVPMNTSTSTTREEWDLDVDVVVLGSGGAALVAAIAARDFGADEVLIVEKSGMVGGTTAMSGGMLWIPMNHHSVEAGVEDSWDEVVAYLDTIAPWPLEPDAVTGFLESGPQMVRHLADRTPVRLRTFVDFPDYQPTVIGAKEHGGRSLDNDVYPFEELGSWATRVNPPKTGVPKLKSRIEDRHGGVSDDELADRQRRDCRGQGQALVGSLLKGVLDRNIPIHFETRARTLCTEGKRVVGVVAEQQRGNLRIRARKGVIIATGGFEWNQQLVDTFLRGPMTGPISVPECEGDGLVMAMEVGASLGNMSNAWWMTSSKESKAGHRDTRPNYLACQAERTCPGSIMVNRAGRRFVNEAVNYNALGYALHNFDPNTHEFSNLPYWMIFDSRYLGKYRMFTSPPGGPAPSWAKRADSLEELAALIGVDGSNLVDTVQRFNANAREGRDPDFDRGATTYDNFAGDPTLPAPYSTLGPLDQEPFYAIEMEAGVNGTCGGPRANGDAQVLDWADRPIEGLYVCSNTMSSVTAGVYGGAGGTLGPGLTFGFIAGRHAAQRS